MTNRSPQAGQSLRQLMAWYLTALAGLLAITVVATLWFANRFAEEAALRNAEFDARTLGQEYVAPLRASDLHTDGEAARQQLRDSFGPRIDQGSLQRVKIWSSAGGTHGTVIFSDRQELESRTFDLGDRAELFGTTEAVANVVNPGDYAQDPEVDLSHEVYVGFVDSAGEPFIFEAYLPAQTQAVRSALMWQWLPLVVGAPVLVLLATLPMTIALVRRTSAADRQREVMARRALDASEDERRLLAQRLHDGVMQDLAGVSLALDSVESAPALAGSAAVVSKAAELVRADLAELRAIGQELSPRALEREGLAEAIRELTRSEDLSHINFDLNFSSDISQNDDDLLAVYRVMREGLRNIAKHSGADRGWLEARRSGDDIIARVRDNGVGVDAGDHSSGSLGLRLLDAAARADGGSLEIESPAVGGTVLTVTFRAGRSAR